MLDMTKTTEAKSDQLNAVDLTGAPKTITITKVAIPGGDQPVTINYEDDGGKPYKPCKGMRRGLVAIWGKDAEQYIGRALTLVINPDVTWGGAAVGGIQISHASDIDKQIKFPLALSKQKRIMFTIDPLHAVKTNAMTAVEFKEWSRVIDTCKDMALLSAVGKDIAAKKYDEKATKKLGSVYGKARDRINAPQDAPEPPPESTQEPVAPSGPPEDMEAIVCGAEDPLKWLTDANSVYPEIVKACLEASGLTSIDQAAESVLFQQVKKAIVFEIPNE